MVFFFFFFFLFFVVVVVFCLCLWFITKTHRPQLVRRSTSYFQRAHCIMVTGIRALYTRTVTQQEKMHTEEKLNGVLRNVNKKCIQTHFKERGFSFKRRVRHQLLTIAINQYFNSYSRNSLRMR